ncbi:MAG: 16S rRNA (adenine(1518)-N(6)/adenine(1519)-N(6))-dimethyltransferase RsmA [Candidatus Omnitrophica bacterium]|nr:16S rRNA (adenine(1518)-N(6)/adenine(1519)-N(6))-dimethyltransferase RsmA [Candidatus Omnitrophota bacterium]
MKQTRALSQVFLRDTVYLDTIIQSLDIENESVLEIGAGAGAITEKLKSKARNLYCVEIDRRFALLLEEKFKNCLNVTILNADILTLPLARFNTKMVIVGNVPYLISNELIRYLVENSAFIERAYLTFQKEFVDKLIARESMKAYGFLSCFIQYYAKVERLFDIPAQAFSPVPKVDSSFVRIEFNQTRPLTDTRQKYLFTLIRRAFSQRRKKIINSLPQLKNQEPLLKTLGISANARAENISLDAYIALANALS